MRLPLLGFALAALCLAQPSHSNNVRLSGPYQHSNLTVFLVHSDAPARTTGRKYIPLQEAIQQKKVVVHETKEVNALAIENVSSDVDVFVQGGDVVKGGQQDRVFTTDLVLPPKSGRTPIATFCVEQGRWTRRGSESVVSFDASSEMVAHKDLKRAVKAGKDQNAVWTEVAKANTKAAGLASGRGSGGGTAGGVIAGMIGGPAASGPPPPPLASTSYQLNMESKLVADKTAVYTKPLQPLPTLHADAVGFVYAINGKFAGGEVYAATSLFRAMWPKALKAAAIEASTESPVVAAKTPVFTVNDAKQAIAAPKLEARTESPNKRTRTAKGASSNVLLFESSDAAVSERDAWLHRSYVAK
jgi:hypothetical protein